MENMEELIFKFLDTLYGNRKYDYVITKSTRNKDIIWFFLEGESDIFYHTTYNQEFRPTNYLENVIDKYLPGVTTMFNYLDAINSWGHKNIPLP